MDIKLLLGVVVVCFDVAFARIIEEEPKCSKYDYEEKLLSKMIKLEHSTGLMMESFETISEDVKNSLAKMKEEFSEIKQEAIKLTTEGHANLKSVRTSIIEMLEEEQRTLKESNQAELDNFRRTIADLTETVSRWSIESYAFSAFWLSNTNPSVGEDLVFTSTLLDRNGVYNNITGKYTVPINGIYIYFSTLCAGSRRYAWIDFYAGDTLISKMFTGDRGYSTCHTGSAIANLKKGTKVFLRVSKDRSSEVVFYNSELTGRNMFSGYLIKPV